MKLGYVNAAGQRLIESYLKQGFEKTICESECGEKIRVIMCKKVSTCMYGHKCNYCCHDHVPIVEYKPEEITKLVNKIG